MSGVRSPKIKNPNEESPLSAVDRRRRAFLQCLVLACVGIAGLGTDAAQAAAKHLEFGPARAFSFDGLIQTARDNAAKPYQ
jgi:glucan biosynthesis protein